MTRRSNHFGAPLLLALSLGACTRWEPATVSPGDLFDGEEPSAVRATLHDSRQVVVEDPLVTSDSIVSRRGCRPTFTVAGVAGCETGSSPVALGDIQELEVRRSDPGATLIGIGLPVLLLAVLADQCLLEC